ncbi:unnamed protein product [Amoebophrya sp. A120]|nr:unnamed protein product [Amoebophrya sp. A120]|eukprot:GSA120T00020463001.1
MSDLTRADKILRFRQKLLAEQIIPVLQEDQTARLATRWDRLLDICVAYEGHKADNSISGHAAFAGELKLFQNKEDADRWLQEELFVPPTTTRGISSSSSSAFLPKKYQNCAHREVYGKDVFVMYKTYSEDNQNFDAQNPSSTAAPDFLAELGTVTSGAPGTQHATLSSSFREELQQLGTLKPTEVTNAYPGWLFDCGKLVVQNSARLLCEKNETCLSQAGLEDGLAGGGAVAAFLGTSDVPQLQATGGNKILNSDINVPPDSDLLFAASYASQHVKVRSTELMRTTSSTSTSGQRVAGQMSSLLSPDQAEGGFLLSHAERQYADVIEFFKAQCLAQRIFSQKFGSSYLTPAELRRMRVQRLFGEESVSSGTSSAIFGNTASADKNHTLDILICPGGRSTTTSGRTTTSTATSRAGTTIAEQEQQHVGYRMFPEVVAGAENKSSGAGGALSAAASSRSASSATGGTRSFASAASSVEDNDNSFNKVNPNYPVDGDVEGTTNRKAKATISGVYEVTPFNTWSSASSAGASQQRPIYFCRYNSLFLFYAELLNPASGNMYRGWIIASRPAISRAKDFVLHMRTVKDTDGSSVGTAASGVDHLQGDQGAVPLPFAKAHQWSLISPLAKAEFGGGSPSTNNTSSNVFCSEIYAFQWVLYSGVSSSMMNAPATSTTGGDEETNSTSAPGRGGQKQVESLGSVGDTLLQGRLHFPEKIHFLQKLFAETSCGRKNTVATVNEYADRIGPCTEVRLLVNTAGNEDDNTVGGNSNKRRNKPRELTEEKMRFNQHMLESFSSSSSSASASPNSEVGGQLSSAAGVLEQQQSTASSAAAGADLEQSSTSSTAARGRGRPKGKAKAKAGGGTNSAVMSQTSRMGPPATKRAKK